MSFYRQKLCGLPQTAALGADMHRGMFFFYK